MAPVAQGERISALDIIRGFALIGILMMNVEYFNRPTADLGSGMQQGLTGLNYYFSFFVMYFVTGKFWTMFSLLFGMGFAVMLSRAEAAGRPFLLPYIRRIVALAVFGALHHIFLWTGDILFSYAVAAVALLIALYGRPKYLLLTSGLFFGLSFIPMLEWVRGIAGGILYFGAYAWYLRAPEKITVFKRVIPLYKIVVGLIMVGGVGAVIASFFIPGIDHEGRIAMPIVGTAFFVLGWLMAKYHNPAELRARRMAVAVYLFQFTLGSALGAGQYFFPDPAISASAPAAVVASAAPAPAVTAPAPSPAAAPAAIKPVAGKAPTEAEKLAEQKKLRAERLAKRKAERDNEVRVVSKGSYAEAVSMRAAHFFEHAPGKIGFATLLINMFLLGTWFVRSGVMANTGAHLPLFRKLAFIALPVGVGLGLLGSLVTTHATPGTPNGWQLASSLLMLGNMPACMGYVGVLVLMLHSRMFAGIKVLAPFGRMALTNYLTHSLVFSLVFYGYGLGYYGMERGMQLVCVLAMVAIQVPLSHLWLRHFRYGPMEWLWRAVTYWQIPALRVAPAERSGAMAHPA
jgi:uncharacterized protein